LFRTQTSLFERCFTKLQDSSTVKHYFKHVKPRGEIYSSNITLRNLIFTHKATTKACGSKLQSLLEEHIEKLEEFKKEAEGITDPHELNELEPMEPLDIVVLSDGSFCTSLSLLQSSLSHLLTLAFKTQADDPTPAIKEAAKALQSKKFPDRSINVFFVQIGNDNGVGQAFKGIEKNAKSSGVAVRFFFSLLIGDGGLTSVISVEYCERRVDGRTAK
jgi:hypothetical protein